MSQDSYILHLQLTKKKDLQTDIFVVSDIFFQNTFDALIVCKRSYYKISEFFPSIKSLKFIIASIILLVTGVESSIELSSTFCKTKSISTMSFPWTLLACLSSKLVKYIDDKLKEWWLVYDI